MSRAVRRDAVAIILVALACGVAFILPPFGFIHGWSIDALTALRWEVFGSRHDPAATPVAVIAIDEETYESPPFKGSPILTWTPEVGRVLDAVIDGGAKVAGFDIVFSTSIEQSEIPFGDDLLGARLRGFDRSFLRSLARGSSAGKVVLGEILRGNGSIRPSAGQRIAVGQQKNIRPLNIYSDIDEVVRRVPLTFPGDVKPISSMALELASRALSAEPVLAPDGSVTLDGYRIPSAVPNTLTLNFEGGSKDIQTFSFADLRACIESNNSEFFRREFSGKVVISWDVFRGGQDAWHRVETAERYTEETLRHARLQRDALELIDKAWAARTITASRIAALQRQLVAEKKTISIYRNEYEIGRLQGDVALDLGLEHHQGVFPAGCVVDADPVVVVNRVQTVAFVEEADALRPLPGERVEAGERQGQMATALVPRHGVDLIDNDCPDRA